MDNFKCINSTFTAEQRQKIKFLPEKGKIYELLEIIPSGLSTRPEGFVFKELPNPNLPDGTRVSFRPSRFVPVDKVDIDSILEAEHFTK